MRGKEKVNRHQKESQARNPGLHVLPPSLQLLQRLALSQQQRLRLKNMQLKKLQQREKHRLLLFAIIVVRVGIVGSLYSLPSSVKSRKRLTSTFTVLALDVVRTRLTTLTKMTLTRQ